MGYRSQIAFCLSVNRVTKEDEKGAHYQEYDKAKFKEMVGFMKLTKFYEIAIGEEYDLLNRKEPCLGWNDGMIVFHAVDWKWSSARWFAVKTPGPLVVDQIPYEWTTGMTDA